MGARPITALIGGMAVVYLLVRGWQVQLDSTDAAVSASVNSSATWQGMESVLGATSTTVAQLPVLGMLAIIALLLVVVTRA
jgi:hypothetical protein